MEPVEGGYRWCSDPRLMLPTAIRLSEGQIDNLLQAIACPTQVIYATPAQSYYPEPMRSERLQHLRNGRLVFPATITCTWKPGTDRRRDPALLQQRQRRLSRGVRALHPRSCGRYISCGPRAAARPGRACVCLVLQGSPHVCCTVIHRMATVPRLRVADRVAFPNSRHPPSSRPAACVAAPLSLADPGVADVRCILPSPDTARLSHQQLARALTAAADRLRDIGYGRFGAGAAWAAGTSRRVGAVAVLPAAVCVPGGRAVARNGLALLLSLQLAVLCAIISLSPALPIALLLGVLLGHRDRLPVWLAGGVGTLSLLAPLLDGTALWSALLQAAMLAGLTLFPGQVALRLRQQTEALGHGPRRLAALARDIATGADLGAHADTTAYAPGSLAHALADTARHVQAQRGREAEAHAENAQIRQALDASRTAMMIADNDHVIRYVNRSVVACCVTSRQRCARPSRFRCRAPGR